MFESLVNIPVTLVSQDPAVVHQMTHLFQDILHCDFSPKESLTEVDITSEDCGSQRVVLYHSRSGPSEGNMELLSHIKDTASTSVVIVLREGNSSVGVDAFFHGADDVASWPCPLTELAIRICVRLGHPLNAEMLAVGVGDWEVLSLISDKADLTTVEAQVISVLYSHQGETVSREDLSLAIDSRPWQYGDRKFDVHVAKIRKKLQRAFGSGISVSTIRSVGYLLSVNTPRIISLS